MKIAALQFSIEKTLEGNFGKIKEAIVTAAEKKARVLVTQECAMSGYPPIEIESIESIDFEAQEKFVQQIIRLSGEYQIFIGLGLIRKVKNRYLNSMMLISPDGKFDYYDKRALWGWDLDNFAPGPNTKGIWEIDGVRIGVRICFEIRFPEYFRELYIENVDLALVSFCDVSKEPNQNRLATIKAHLLTRAIENCFTVLSVNGTTFYQTAPTCVFNPDGVILKSAPIGEETIMFFDFEKTEPDYGRKGRIHYSNQLVSV